MTHWRDIFRFRETRFLDLLTDQTRATLDGIRVLHEFVMTSPSGPDRQDLIRKMSALEKQGDQIRRCIIRELLNTFVTPFDREDINALSLSIDHILDYADSTIKAMMIYEVAPTPSMQEMVQLLHDGVYALGNAVERMLEKPGPAIQDMIIAKRAENSIEDVYRSANSELFSMTDVHYIFKVREIYRHLSNGADRLDEAADIIGSVVIKGNV